MVHESLGPGSGAMGKDGLRHENCEPVYMTKLGICQQRSALDGSCRPSASRQSGSRLRTQGRDGGPDRILLRRKAFITEESGTICQVNVMMSRQPTAAVGRVLGAGGDQCRLW